MKIVNPPTLVVYWADTHALLSYWECREALEVVSITPSEVLLLHVESKRNVVVRGSLDPDAPALPPEK